jgi:hypothetical protein
MMAMIKLRMQRLPGIVTLMLLATILVPLAVSAADISSGTLLLGDPRPGQSTTYTFSGSGFTTGTAIRCAQLTFAVNADGSGGVPSGLTTTSATLVSSTLITAGSWTVGNAGGVVRITNASGETPASTGNIVWGGIVNGSTSNQTYYALFNTYTNVDCSTGPVDSTVVAYTYKDGSLVSLTVDPTLVFTVSGVANGQSVNGATTSISSTPTEIDFARTANATTKGVSAHDLEVATNAGGFSVYLRQTGAGLSNGSHTISPWTGTNASPTPFPAAGTEAWGYTTEDNTLGGGTATRFTSASNWAGMPTVNELVMDNSSAGSQETRVGHQLGVSGTTPAGNYTTTLVYTAAGTY